MGTRRLARVCWGRYLDKPEEERRILEGLLTQTPASSGVWEDVVFTIDRVTTCDFLLIADAPSIPLEVVVPPDNVWSFTIEPPNEYFTPLHRRGDGIARCYTSDDQAAGEGVYRTFVPINWHIGKSFDELRSLPCPSKPYGNCLLSSASACFKGHRDRVKFIQRLAGEIPFHLFGRGYADFDNKYEVLKAYRNAVVIENFANSLYWSEKLADTFLAYTLPLYYGCTDISRYFSADALIPIDINAPDIMEQLRALPLQRLWGERIEAIRQARYRILYEYNFFAFFSHQILMAPVGKAKQTVIPASPHALL